jgi:hypothetical protein
MLPTNTEERMPAIVAAQAHHGKTAKGTIADDGTIRGANMGSQSLTQLLNTRPQSLSPLRLPWHHFPDERHHPRVLYEANVDDLSMLLIRSQINATSASFTAWQQGVSDTLHHDTGGLNGSLNKESQGFTLMAM